jgi:hypothetical protein
MQYLLFIILIFPTLVLACSWTTGTNNLTFDEQVEVYIASADYVFLGSVDEYEWKPNAKWKHDKPWHYHKITPLEQFKGNIQGSIEYWPATSCGEVFSDVGKRFVFFGVDSDKTIQFHVYTGAIPMNHANSNDLIDKLRKLNEKPSNK